MDKYGPEVLGTVDLCLNFVMPRLMLTDELWSKLKAILLEDRVYNKLEHRQTLEGILYRLRVGCPWRDLPECFGLWNTIYRRFLLWSAKAY